MSKPIEGTTPRRNPNLNYGFGMLMMCQGRFILHKKCTILMRDTDSGGDYAGVGAVGVWEISYLPLNFTINLKLLYKIVLKFKKK